MLTQARLKEVFTYDPETGVFFKNAMADRSKWWNAKHAGKPAGWVSAHGDADTLPYIRIALDGKSYFAHRLAWFYMTGEWPKDEIDHISGHGLDNRWANLRDATKSQNAWNTGIRRNNTSGFKGVSWDRARGKWMVMMTLSNKQRSLGRFDTIEEAVAAHDAAVEKYHGDFAASVDRRRKETA